MDAKKHKQFIEGEEDINDIKKSYLTASME